MDIIHSIKSSNTITENPSILKKINKIIKKNNITHHIFIELCKIETINIEIIKYYLNYEKIERIKEGYT